MKTNYHPFCFLPLRKSKQKKWSKRDRGYAHGYLDFVKQVFFEKQSFINLLRRTLHQDSKHRTDGFMSNKTEEKITILDFELEIVLNLAKRSIISNTSSFSMTFQEGNAAEKRLMAKDFYSRLIFAAVRRKFEDYRKLLKENQEQTIQNGRRLLMEHFDKHVGNPFILGSNEGPNGFYESLEYLRRCTDDEEDLDCAVLKEQTNNFQREIVSETPKL